MQRTNEFTAASKAEVVGNAEKPRQNIWATPPENDGHRSL